MGSLDALPRRVWLRGDLSALLAANKAEWKLPASMTAGRFLSYLLEKSLLREVELVSERYGSLTRYVWRNASQYEVFSSIKPRSYLVQATAIFLHNLTDLDPKIIYVNSEQTPKPPANRDTISQATINRAFANKQRESQLIYKHSSQSCVVISGKNTGDLGVVEFRDANDIPLRLTDLERTLIDAVVRPSYAGGFANVAEAYARAAGRLSTNRIIAYLKKLNHAYPYHQIIGFLMTRTGHPRNSIAMVRDLGISHDFFADYGMKNPDFDSDWRVFFPKGL